VSPLGLVGGDLRILYVCILFVRVSKWEAKIHTWPAAAFLDAERYGKGRRGTLLFCISDLVASAVVGTSIVPPDAGFAGRNGEEIPYMRSSRGRVEVARCSPGNARSFRSGCPPLARYWPAPCLYKVRSVATETMLQPILIL
jgi:hypothetical protein